MENQGLTPAATPATDLARERVEEGEINIYGARVHNLKNVDVTLPRNSLSVITGLSGSGKSSLAFDTLYAEGQRRYIETFSAYARNFMDNIERPDVDKITGLSPVISIEQKTTNKNPRSTVGTTTEIYDYLRLLYARAGIAYSYATGEEMVKYTEEDVLKMIHTKYDGKKIFILAPLVRNRKGHYRELFENMRKKGYLHIRVDGEVKEIVRGMKTDRYKNHNIEVVIDKLQVQDKDDERLKKSVAAAMKQGDGLLMIMEKDTNEATKKLLNKRIVFTENPRQIESAVISTVGEELKLELTVAGEKKILFAGYKDWKCNDMYPNDFTKRYHAVSYAFDEDALYLSVGLLNTSYREEYCLWVNSENVVVGTWRPNVTYLPAEEDMTWKFTGTFEPSCIL